MILFFGTRPGKSETKSLDGVSCPYCNQTSTLNAFISSNYFHLFWIKLFKISSSKVVECSHCKRVFYPEEFSEAMSTAIEN
ncbi:zinc-ribbon domain-containing protein [Maribacter sp. PR1]|uniref:Zinc-ribbon domain-containing protein n=1 Tax=Maribacter cobaltidurans TaxID=1178778 RepID=A0ABU7IZB0_9FLAO|nr:MULTISPECIES: zinc-ribbon domain-containing protein [Maribacter]MDC6390771.1 zinc-ribbon domain-containing protein [Maribacter sp. PR1]MEE1978163.1 zinc-ribbon domain-containing protein [Maribacter cobaltidurans]